MKLSKYMLISFIVLIMFMLAGCSTAAAINNPTIIEGQLDLSGWDFSKAVNIKLDGEWEFYWNRLLSYQDLQGEKPDLFADVPNVWNTYTLNGTKLPGEGYATYRLHVRTDLPAGTQLGLRSYAFSSAYDLYINGMLAASNGRVAAVPSEEIGEYRPQAIIFSTPGQEFDIIIQVSNFHYARGGFWYSMFMGSVESILNLHDNMMGKENFLLGALTIISLFFFAVYILRRELRYTLYFALLCMVMAVGVDMVGQYIIPRFFTSLNLKWVIFLWYSSATWVTSLLILFVHELFPSKFSGIVQRVYLVFAMIWQTLYIFTSPTFYTRFGHISNYTEAAGILCTVLIVAIGIKKGNKGGWLNIISMAILLIAYIHDTLYWTNVLKSSIGEIFYIGLFLFMFIQMVIQAQRIKLFHDQETAAELAFLQAQIKPHFLYNALNTIISISHYDIDKARELLTTFSNYLRRSFDFKDLSQFVSLRNEIELARAYVEIEKARFEERIEVTFEVYEELEVWVPMLMLQPVIENAVIHGILPKPKGGKVDVSVKKEVKTLVFSVKDNGIGMDAKKLCGIMKNETAKGVGLANIDARLRKLYRKGLEITSSPSIGTEITWSIQINNRRG